MRVGLGRVRFNVPPNTGTGFYGSKDPTNSVKALKEDAKDSALQSHEVHLTVLH